jgi:hypothetical protein
MQPLLWQTIQNMVSEQQESNKAAYKTKIWTLKFVSSIFTSSSCLNVVTSPSLPSFDSLAAFSAA